MGNIYNLIFYFYLSVILSCSSLIYLQPFMFTEKGREDKEREWKEKEKKGGKIRYPYLL